MGNVQGGVVQPDSSLVRDTDSIDNTSNESSSMKRHADDQGEGGSGQNGNKRLKSSDESPASHLGGGPSWYNAAAADGYNNGTSHDYYNY